ncbi:MAG TPA: twin-arginine translocation signal domain-containing protein [Acidobacteriaceae bacterium]
MSQLNRRRFLKSSAAAAALASSPVRSLAQATASARATLTLHADQSGATVPANFIGLSYEIEQLSDPSFFSRENTGLIEQFRALSPNGVLRLGGNTSDVGWWKPTPASTPPPMNVRNTGVGEPNASLAYAITPDAITNLRAFLEATNWTCLFGINLGTNTPERAADQAAFVAKALGGRLQYFQIGNEPDLFRTHLRDPKTWNANTYFDEWSAMAEAIRARVPDAKFGLPDTAGNPEWYAAVVDRLLAMPTGTRPRIASLTHHYYFGGPPSNPDVNIGRLLQPDPHVLTLAHDISAAAARLSAGIHAPVPYRMSEGNTCFRGGKPGVSDVFAATLWAADYCLLLASLGYVGVNLHGGSAKQVANSLGGHLPGEDLLANPNEPHPKPFYTPIADINGGYVAEPVNYGMRFAGNFAGARMLRLTFEPGSVDATAYAAKLPSEQTIVAIINKDAKQPLQMDLAGYSVGHVLTAESLTSRSVEDREPSSNREASTVPPATAMLLYSSRV